MKPITTCTTAAQLYILCALILTACSKSKNDLTPIPDNSLYVTFSASTVLFTKVDSATVVLKKTGSQTEYFLHFNKASDKLHFPLDGFSAGEWTADMYIFSRYDDKGGRLFHQQKTFTMPLTGQAIGISGPTGALTDSWQPSAFIRDNTNGISITIPLDATDPHFDIQVADSKWNSFSVERAVLKKIPGTGNELKATDTWACNNGCYTHNKAIINNTAFVSFAQQAATKDWNNGELTIIVKDEQAGVTLDYFCPYNK